VQAPIAPNLKIPEQSCARLDMPAIPQDVSIEIHGDKVTADEGGKVLLRGYVRARELLR
jgi:hypothetical protein